MVSIAPLRGVFYNQKKIRDLTKVIAPPYDVISKDEQEKLHKRSPYNFVRLDLSQDSDVYAAVPALLERWTHEGVFERDPSPAIYYMAHRFTLPTGEQKNRRGFFALLRLEDFATGNVRPHERTLAAPKKDRLQLMLATNAQLSPIFALYSQPQPSINRTLAMQIEGIAPFIEVTQENAQECALWRITDMQVIRRLQEYMREESLLIADGHHRYEAALDYCNHLRAQRSSGSGREAYNFVLTYFANLIDDNVVILPTHRLVRGYEPKPFLQLEEELQKYFYLEQYPKTPEGKGWFLKALRTGGKKKHVIGAVFKRDPRYLILRLKSKRIMQRLAKDASAQLQELDVTTLHLLILEHVLGLGTERQVSGETTRYSQDEEAVLQALEKEDFQAAFILNPPKADEVLAIASKGETMPQKSTYFYPKLPSGLIVNKIDQEEEIET
ncbi:MAG TPA: DUF1015 domain-containing protein [Candidatus Binatia bacterium]|nr:DUF1015 domain-containing protein [Candidatus Binatia bacterium]